MANFDTALEKLLIKEGGDKVVNIKNDRGGLTKWGISQRSYPNLDIRNLTKQQAAAIYKNDYWDKFSLDFHSSQAIAEIQFEAAVNMGVNSLKRILALIDEDSTQEQLHICQLKLALIMRYCYICNKNRSQKKFLLGWLNRVLS